jgi:voltage-gated potassium channel
MTDADSRQPPETPMDPPRKPESSPTRARWRERLYIIIFEAETPSGKAFDIALIVAIFVSVFVVILSTLPAAAEEPYRRWLLALEWMFTALFTIEYILRLIVARRRWRYARSFFGVIDLLAILPAFIGLVVPGGERLLVVRTLRLLRIFRVLKLTRFLSEANSLRLALVQSRHKIAVFLASVLIVVLIASAVMHIVEANAGNEPFNSMPSAMYWAVITMTTVGYGDIVPVTIVGKLTTAVLVLFGYSLIIVPTGIVTAEMSGFRRRDPYSDRACPSCGLQGHEPDAHYCRRCGESLDVSS